MKDQVQLLIAGLICAAMGWAFWAVFGEAAQDVLSAIIMIGFALDRGRSRRKEVKGKTGGDDPFVPGS